jgi:hypothetical protein
MALSIGGKAKPRKQFFFEKKNQKTFDYVELIRGSRGAAANEQKFFGSFFQKRTASFLLAPHVPQRDHVPGRPLLCCGAPENPII